MYSLPTSTTFGVSGAGDLMREPQAARRRRETRNAKKRSVHSNGDDLNGGIRGKHNIRGRIFVSQWRSRLRGRLAQDRVEDGSSRNEDSTSTRPTSTSTARRTRIKTS